MEKSNVFERNWQINGDDDKNTKSSNKNSVKKNEQAKITQKQLKDDAAVVSQNQNSVDFDFPDFDETIANKVSTQKTSPTIWALGGGKGGVGKSFIAANFSISLAQKGYKVLAIDLDLGGANLHTCLGVKPPKTGLGDWAFNRFDDLEDIMIDTSWPGLKLISGATDEAEINQAIVSRKQDLLEGIRAIDFDHVIIDLGAGTLSITTDLFQFADQGILSILPEPTSVENAYRFIRNALFKKITTLPLKEDVQGIVLKAMDQKNNLNIKTPFDLISYVQKIDFQQASIINEVVSNFSPNIVINQARSQADVEVGSAIVRVCKKFFGINAFFAGHVDYDNGVWKSVRAKQAVLSLYPRSTVATRLGAITNNLIKKVSSP